MTGSRTEASLLSPISRFVRARGFNCQLEELQFYEYRIDLYGYSLNRDLTIAVELKLKDWRRAIQQALVYQLCADAAYVAMPVESCRKADRDALVEFGIGMIGIASDNKCTEILAPRRNSVLRKHYREEYIYMLMESLK